MVKGGHAEDGADAPDVLCAGRGVVREFIQHEATAGDLAAEIERILADAGYAERIRSDLAAVRARLGEPGCSRRVAKLLVGMLHSTF